ncbi:hypothetical protein NL676_004547 [Syzygium grande]|nr:hypothetical protein NL676_004547 [Syzygium grande]
MDVRLESTPSDKASQNRNKPISFHGFMRITDQSETTEVHIDMSLEGTTFDEASQDDRTPTKVTPIGKVYENYRDGLKLQ